MVAERVGPGGGADGENPDRFRSFSFMGPQMVDQTIRQAISCCWMMIPEEKRSIAAVEAEVRRIFERALKDLREDSGAFGLGGMGKEKS